MKAILYLAITINGIIADENHHVPWTNDQWEAYCAKVKKIGNLIIGRVTFPLFEEGDYKKMGNPYVVVLTKRKFIGNRYHTSAKSIQEALNKLEKKGI